MPTESQQRIADAKHLIGAIKIVDKYGFTTAGTLLAEVAEYIAGQEVNPAPTS